MLTAFNFPNYHDFSQYTTGTIYQKWHSQIKAAPECKHIVCSLQSSHLLPWPGWVFQVNRGSLSIIESFAPTSVFLLLKKRLSWNKSSLALEVCKAVSWVGRGRTSSAPHLVTFTLSLFASLNLCPPVPVENISLKHMSFLSRVWDYYPCEQRNQENYHEQCSH